MTPFHFKDRWLLCLLLCQPTWSSGGETIPVPPAGTDGPTASADPFVFNAFITSSRFQQVYDASAFSLINQDGGWITGLYWAADLVFGRGDWSAYLPSVEISLSVTMRGPDRLSSVFDDNLTSSATIVHPRGPLLLVGGGRGSRVDLPFQTPFLYDPLQGHLLLEIRTYEPTYNVEVPQWNVGPLDAYREVGDPVSRVYAYDVNASGGLADTLGLTTYFLVTPVPEPSALGLLVLVTGLWGLHWLHKNRRSTQP
jgi:hypothetical protein